MSIRNFFVYDRREVEKMSLAEIQASINLSKKVGLACAVSILILLAFSQISKYTNDWTWFARSGSLLVVVGVLLAVYDVRGKMTSANSPMAYKLQALAIESLIIVVGTLVWGFGDLISHFY